ncbi:hypothetical protein [Nostoc sp. TCL26-01]|uniref:hypothetical protein n=1 Tax=Nostoc sp. TCL26-01 TaxID=2576904 RepID=UPI0015BBFDE3|nr:hypothetical protein [Nostoc sp. TCL26-01]QLE57061.1 hypothetical protein FD725_16965 [Nostoc sp. TCL26-01]
MKKLILATVLSICSLIGPLSLTATAQGWVVINGELFQGQKLYNLERLLGYSIPSGRYWLDVNTGDWGYEGNPRVQGNILRPNQSSSTPGRRTPFGDILENGGYFDPNTGCSVIPGEGLSC